MNKILVIVFLAFSYFLLQAQPSSPKIIGITYSHENYYSISWEAVAGAESYRISTFNNLTNNGLTPDYKTLQEGISEINALITIPDDTVVFFSVEAFGGGKYSSSSLWPWRKAPSNILLKHEFDTCNPSKLILRWNQYYYPEPVEGGYLIFCNDNRIDKINYETLDSSTSVVIKNIEKFLVNNKVVFQVTKTTTNGYCSSNKITFEMPTLKKGPSFIEATGTNIWDEKTQLNTTDLQAIADGEPAQIKLNFYADPESELNKYVIYRSLGNAVAGFDSIDIIDGGPYLSYVDEPDSLGTRQYFYKIAALNNCDQVGLESNVESSIPLKLRTENYSVNFIEWPSYQKFKGKLKEYKVYRVRANKSDVSIVTTKENAARDDLSSITDKDVKEQVCYYVVAYEENNPNNINARAVSNLICMSLPETIEMPKYLVLGESCQPNTNSIYHFKPAGGTARPSKWYMAVMDRWGTKVFESNEIEDGWDGSYDANGKTAPQGGYVYFYKYTNKEGKTFEAHGSFVVLCK